MKKLISILLTAAIGASVITACDQQAPAETNAPEETTIEETAAAPAEINPEITDDLRNLFDTGMEGLMGVGYEPILFLGTASDNPVESVFLCRAQVVTPDEPSYWAIVSMTDIGDGVQIQDIEAIDIATSSTASDVVLGQPDTEVQLGSWSPAQDSYVDPEIFNVDGVTAYALLSTQVVSGTNYCYIGVDGNNWNLYYLYADLNGNIECTNVASLAI